MELCINSPQVAVIVATKNRPQLLRDRALHSISKQTHAAKYLIIVDDSDPVYWQKNKKAIECNNFPVDRVHYLTNQRTPGASGAWNTAIDLLVSNLNVKSNNLYLAFLDDDDEWHLDMIANLLNAIKTGKGTDKMAINININPVDFAAVKKTVLKNDINMVVVARGSTSISRTICPCISNYYIGSGDKSH